MKKISGPILPGSTIGILGAGQRGKMLAMKALQLGYKVIVFGDMQEGVAYTCCTEKIYAPYNDIPSMDKFARRVDVVLTEFENIPTSVLEYLEKFTNVYPGSSVFKITRDRLLEKELCHTLQLETTRTVTISCLDDIHQLTTDMFPGRLKTRTMRHAEKEQHDVANISELQNVWIHHRNNGTVTFVYEKEVNFFCELSVIVARNSQGEIVRLPIIQNEYEKNILRKSTYPAPFFENTGIQTGNDLEAQALSAAICIAQKLEVIGLIAVKMFVTTDYKILVNRITPCPDNSGYVSMDAFDIDQYEMYIRAACNLPMIQPTSHSAAVMTNLFGEEVLDPSLFEKNKGYQKYVHIYGKTGIRPERKMGHVTQISSLAGITR